MPEKQLAEARRPVAIVTGGARSLGLATARALAGRGFDVAITGRTAPDAIDPAIAQSVTLLGARCVYFQHDTTDVPSHAAFVAAVQAAMGPLACLVNNVGLVSRTRRDVLELQPEDLDAMYDVNVKGTFFLAQAFANAILGSPRSDFYTSIINVTSIAAEILNVQLAAYCMSKSALSMATRVLALRLADQGIMVHEVRPGFLWREGQPRDASPSPLDLWIANGGLPMKRRGEAAEIAKAIAALGAGDIPYTTGQPVWLAGGINIPTAF